MNGLEAASLIKQFSKETVIVGLSGGQDTYTREAFLKAGALAVVAKDRPNELHATIQRACANKQSSFWTYLPEPQARFPTGLPEAPALTPLCSCEPSDTIKQLGRTDTSVSLSPSRVPLEPLDAKAH
jgi:DNA-binding NarL/FixJ family response regulator